MSMISIVTSTYNRADLLVRCWESLYKQTSRDFEWIIVDDGSIDDTESVVEGLIARSANDAKSFSIKYFHKENGGKHTALNVAAKHVSGEYVLFLDSDDYLTPDAVEKCIDLWKKYEADARVGMVIFLKGESRDKPCCSVSQADEGHPVDFLKTRRITYIHSDCCEVVRSDLFVQHPFPEYPHERFMAEGALWNKIGLSYMCVYSNEVIYLCKYLDDGLTKAGRSLRIHNPNGGMYNASLCMRRGNHVKTRVKNAVLYTCYGFFAKKPVLEMLDGCTNKRLMLTFLPFGGLLYMYWKRYL